MQLGRYQVSTLRPPPILSIDFSVDGRVFGVAKETGYEVWRAAPLGLLRRRKLPGTLAKALPLPDSPLVALQGGGNSPLYPPNKVVIYHDAIGQAVSELEFSERVRGIISRRGAIFVALSRRVLAFEYGNSGAYSHSATGVSDVKGKGKARDAGSGSNGFWVTKLGEWETALNEHGLMAVSTAPGSTLLTIPGRQAGHVQLIHLAPCPPLNPSRAVQTTAYRSPIILAHTHHLSSLACSASGSHIVTTSERGTLLRVWDTARGRLERELRRGVDRAEMWGAVLEEGIQGFEVLEQGAQGVPGGRVVGWSDKGTVHMWGEAEQKPRPDTAKSQSVAPSLTNMLSRNLPLPKYFSSMPSTALYHLPRKNPHAFASAIGAAAEKARMPSMKMSQADEDGEWSERFVVGWVEVDVEVDVQPASPTVSHGQASAQKIREDLMGGIGMGTREERRSFGSDRTATTTIGGGVTGTMMGTSRTPTPTMGRNTPLGTGAGALPAGSRPNRFMPAQMGSRPGSGAHERSFSGSSRETARPARRVRVSGASGVGAGGGVGAGKAHGTGVTGKAVKKERQLVAITYGGDWYRLRIPSSASAGTSSPAGGNGAATTSTTVSSSQTSTAWQGQAGGGEAEEETKKARRLELVEYRRLNVGGGGW